MLIGAILLTLVVVPIIFTYVDTFQNWLGKRLRGTRWQRLAAATGEKQGRSANYLDTALGDIMLAQNRPAKI